MLCSSVKAQVVFPEKRASTTFTNPIITADFSDPDIIRVGNDYYMTASSFYVAPGLPVLHSKDLVNWTIIGHGIKQNPNARLTYRGRSKDELDYNVPRLGKGVYAPSLRYHDGFFLIFWGDPDAGSIWLKLKMAPINWRAAGKITVRHASFYDVPRAGINISEVTFGGHVIEYCDVFNTVLETWDHGSFRSFFADKNCFVDKR